jgi:hypothetical protein
MNHVLLIDSLFCEYTDAFPDPTEMKDYIATGAGYLQGGLQRENWERCTLSIVRWALKRSIQPGINYFIKHVGTIFRALFQVALQDISYRDPDTSQLFKNCPLIKNHLNNKFDEMIWELMSNAADQTHSSLEPWYSCLDPNLPGFHPAEEDDEDGELYQKGIDGEYVKTPSKREIREMNVKDSLLGAITNFIFSRDGSNAKDMLREREMERAKMKKSFLPEKRTSMINEDETDKILTAAMQYVFALNEQIQTYLNFQCNYFIYNAFKEKMGKFPQIFTTDDSWESMIPDDETLGNSIDVLKDKISGLQDSLNDIQTMQLQF